jgi:hypothetical protein
MWQFGDYEPIRGEDKMKEWVDGSLKIQEEIIKACEAVSDDKAEQRIKQIQKSPDNIDIDVED